MSAARPIVRGGVNSWKPCHTTGDWRAIEWNCHAATTIVVDDPTAFTGKRVIAEFGEPQDARLGACAGRMLDLLKQCCQECIECAGVGVKIDNSPCDDEVCVELRNVIADAEGQP